MFINGRAGSAVGFGNIFKMIAVVDRFINFVKIDDFVVIQSGWPALQMMQKSLRPRNQSSFNLVSGYPLSYSGYLIYPLVLRKQRLISWSELAEVTVQGS